MPTSSDLITFVGGGTVLGTLVVLVVRFVLSNLSGRRLEKITTDAEAGTFARMQSEISRLSNLCDNLSMELSTLKVDREFDIVDLSSLLVQLGNMPCGRCEIDAEVFRRVEAALKSIIDRKLGVMPPSPLMQARAGGV